MPGGQLCFSRGGGGANKQRYYAGATTDPLLSWILQLYNSIPFQKTPLNIFTPDDTESPNFAVWLTDYIYFDGVRTVA